ncbi:hypothetical protein SJ05684_b51650 (plasmid) [Sinorhizobium sojae CCBAU 05684]|uniref:Uncharacterized protein n=1 Tax=Sinorhizobium sojae CCBAU 05684 TaxID=716928 RepID=A0A249PK77_9HYPH|nr:hypothetical protein [Sinorhizobium sojae]ASY66147.1 hypothetical protein SJ05684_b51650 [Sinorhizobium sojae CCBAU 05684]
MENICYLLDAETTLFKAVALPNGISFKPLYHLLGCRLLELGVSMRAFAVCR